MARLPEKRTTHLTSDEIVAEALRQFDGSASEPSIRDLATALQVAPAAIYHHFPSRALIVQEAVDRVWIEASLEVLKEIPEPLKADPAEVLVAIGIASRRAWLRHFRLAPYLAASPRVSKFTRDTLELMANLFERLGLTDERAAAAFHSYSSFMIGSVLFAAGRMAANETLASGDPDPGARPSHLDPASESTDRPGQRTRHLMDAVMDVSVTDPARDEELYRGGLQQLVAGLTARGS